MFASRHLMEGGLFLKQMTLNFDLDQLVTSDTHVEHLCSVGHMCQFHEC